MDHSEILKQVRKIELKMRGLAQHVFAGQYQSAFKGRGMSFSEVRAYQYGDDVRSIDWNVTSRFRSPHIKVFEEERELSVFLIIDVSGSMYFGMAEQSKISLAVLLLATLGFSAALNGDKVGVVLVSDEVEDYIPPKKGTDHVNMMIRRLLNLQPKSKRTDFSAGTKLLLNLHKQKSICFVLSDFPNPSAIKEDLSKLKKKHDVIGLQLTDLGERSLPKVGFVRWYNAETQTTSWIDTSSNAARQEVENKQKIHDREIAALFNSLQLDFLALETGVDPYNSLVTLFRHRK